MFKSYARSALRWVERSLWGGHKPNFIIVGAQKSGTTSLYNYLNDCPGLIGSQIKEVHYFDREDRFRKGDKWYESFFVNRKGADELLFEASPSYLCREKVPERLNNYNQDLKFIVMLRDPIDRAYSAWNMYRLWSSEGVVPRMIADDQYGRNESPIYQTFFKNECPSFTDYIKLEMELIHCGDHEEEPSLLRRGLYKEQIQRYVNLFGWKNVLVVGFGELKKDSESVIRKCHEFLGVPYYARGTSVKREIRGKRSYPAKICSSDLDILLRFYEQPNKELFQYLGFKPDW